MAVSLLTNTAVTPTVAVNAQTGTTYTLVSSDAFKLVTASNTSAITVTVPASVFTTGQYIYVQAINTGVVTITGDGTSVITSTGATAALPKLKS